MNFLNSCVGPERFVTLKNLRLSILSIFLVHRSNHYLKSEQPNCKKMESMRLQLKWYLKTVRIKTKVQVTFYTLIISWWST